MSPAAFLQGSGLGTVLSNIFIDDLDRGGECTINSFEDNNKMGGGDDSLKEQDALQGDLGRLEHWAMVNGKEFKKNKSQSLHLGWSDARHKYELGKERLESSPADRDMRVLVGSRLITSQLCALVTRRANCILGCVKHSSTSQVREVMAMLYQCWCGLTLSTVYSSGHHSLQRMGRYPNVSRGGQQN